MIDLSAQIAENVASVRGRIADAAARSGRTAADIMLVAVTKYVSADLIHPLVEAGCNDLGESRPQQLWEKAAALADLPIRWHFVGHLQRNKVRRTLPLVAMIHSVDSLRLLAAIDEDRRSPLPLGEGQGVRAAWSGVTPRQSSASVGVAVALPPPTEIPVPFSPATCGRCGND